MDESEMTSTVSVPHGCETQTSTYYYYFLLHCLSVANVISTKTDIFRISVVILWETEPFKGFPLICYSPADPNKHPIVQSTVSRQHCRVQKNWFGSRHWQNVVPIIHNVAEGNRVLIKSLGKRPKIIFNFKWGQVIDKVGSGWCRS